MSFPINICTHNKEDVLSWKMVFYHVIITHLHWHFFTAFRLQTQRPNCDYQYLNTTSEQGEKITAGFVMSMG